MSNEQNEQFTKWALDPKGGGWEMKPLVRQTPWNREQKAFTAGIEAERNRLRALVEKEIEAIKERRRGMMCGYSSRIDALEEVISLLTDPQPEPDKTDSNE